MGIIESDLRILVADDDDDDFFLLKELIQEGIREVRSSIDHVSNMEQIISALEKETWDLLFLDYRMGSHNGIDILKAIRKRGIKTPTILLTGQGDQEVAVDAMKAGASDYIVKSNLSVDMLTKAVRHSLAVFKEEAHRKRVEGELYNQGILLQGVSDAANRLLTIHDHEMGLREALAILGKAAEVDPVMIFNDHPHMDSGEGAFSLKMFWSQEPDGEWESRLSNLSYRKLGMNEIVKKLATGQIVSGPIDDFGEGVKNLFKDDEIKSIVWVPIKIDYIYWGFIVFVNRQRFRTWTKDEESILKTFAASIGGELKRYRDDMAFRSIVQGTSTQMGDEFFRSLVKNLASALPARCAFVSELLDFAKGTSRVIAGWDGENFVNNFQYEMANSAYEDVIAGMFSYYPDNVQKIFPKEEIFQKLRAKSYAGVPFFDSSMKVIGHLTVLDDRSMVDKQRTSSILRIFAARAGAELERKRAEETIKNMAYFDSLTGLPNRVLLNDRLNLALERARRYKKMLAVLFLDFDNFKEINDTFGHAIGDRLLQVMADRLKGCLRGEDTVARLGGDEFILLLPEIQEKENAAYLAEKLVKVGRLPIDLDGNHVAVSFSIGIALFPDDADCSKSLLKKADEALYNAKNRGRNRYAYSQ